MCFCQEMERRTIEDLFCGPSFIKSAVIVMRNILVLGAGRSATSLISYLLDHAQTDGFGVCVCDLDLTLAQKKIGGHHRGTAHELDIHNEPARRSFIRDSSVVISMLPPPLHQLVALDCLDLGCHLLTASYLSDELEQLHDQVSKKNLLFMSEMGLDPGIDHMSAMRLIAEIRGGPHDILSFKSYTGGLISPESDDNPWHYKITWNPRNVVLAGKKVARFREQDHQKFLPHNQLFKNAMTVDVPDYGSFEMYPNRDSIPYAKIYGFPTIGTIVRGTLRHHGFCNAWSALVDLGLTDHETRIDGRYFATYRDLLSAFLPGGKGADEEKIKARVSAATNQVVDQVLWLLDQTPVPNEVMTMADFMEYLIIRKWCLKENDRDLVVMYHEVEYMEAGSRMRGQSSMVMQGRDQNHTAMAALVGLPLGICARLLHKGQIRLVGVHRPVHHSVFLPVLTELEKYGVIFSENAYKLE